MPGVGRTQFVFKDETPWIVKVKHFAPKLPTTSCPFPIQIKPGVVAFVPSWLGHYDRSNLWGTLGLLGLLALIFCWYGLKGQVIRVR